MSIKNTEMSNKNTESAISYMCSEQ